MNKVKKIIIYLSVIFIIFFIGYYTGSKNLLGKFNEENIHKTVDSVTPPEYIELHKEIKNNHSNLSLTKRIDVLYEYIHNANTPKIDKSSAFVMLGDLLKRKISKIKAEEEVFPHIYYLAKQVLKYCPHEQNALTVPIELSFRFSKAKKLYKSKPKLYTNFLDSNNKKIEKIKSRDNLKSGDEIFLEELKKLQNRVQNLVENNN